MPKKKDGRAMWFKLNLHQKPLIDAVPDETVGKALKAAMAYFQNREQIELDPLTTAVFSVLKASADEALDDYAKAVADGKKGGRPTVPNGIPPLPIPTEEDKDRNIDKEGNKRGSESDGADKPPSPPKKSYGEYGWVKLTIQQYEKLVNDLGESEVKRCIDYIDESAQTTGNKNKWRDWNLIVRKCSREGWGKSGYNKAEPQKPKYNTGVRRV